MFRPWTHTSEDSYIYQLSLVVATATVSHIYSLPDPAHIFASHESGKTCYNSPPSQNVPKMDPALCSMILAYCKKNHGLVFAKLGILRDRCRTWKWGSWTTCDIIENSRRVTRALRILTSVVVILPLTGNGAWSGLPGLKL